MIPINSPAVYEKALEILQSATGRGFRGRAAQIWLACKHYGNEIPRIGSSVGIESRQLQRLLDELYMKQSRTTPEKIAIIFENDHKVPTGTTDGGLNTASNIWRNNLNLQKGFICYASALELQNPTFHGSSRKLCPHLRPAGTKTLVKSWCDIKGKPPEYRGEDNPKIFRKDPITEEYTVHDPQDVAFYSSIIRPPSGKKLPIAALIVTLYYDSFLSAGRTQVDVGDFISDFGFTSAEAGSYFDDDPASASHQALAFASPGITWARLTTATASSTPPVTLPGLPPLPVPRISKRTKSASSPHAPSIGTTASPPPPAVSGWWDAQQAVSETLRAAGWSVSDASRHRFGYDLQIMKHGILKLVEVKSSVGICTPSLTKNEYDRAALMRRNYVLAIVENFDPKARALIQWIEDPAHLQMTQRHVVEYTLPRSIWRKHTGAVP